jgi:hypothetical protein
VVDLLLVVDWLLPPHASQKSPPRLMRMVTKRVLRRVMMTRRALWWETDTCQTTKEL